MNIRDEAVEAVLKVLSEHVDASECCARAALEAVAPHLMAAAWERGREDGYHHRPNPYKETGE